jgi:CHAT domain-containing protein
MSEPLILLAFSLILPLSATQADTAPAVYQDPRSMVRQATQAVEGDSAGHLTARWRAGLQYDPRDRAAAIGLATIARLTYDFPTADEYYRRVYDSDSTRPDRHTVYARLGLAQGLYAEGRMQEADTLFARARMDARALRDRGAEGEALFWLGTVRVLFQGPEEALALLDTALSVLPARAQDLQTATRCRRAHMLVVLGRADAARELGAALALARRLGDPLAEGHCLRALAMELRYRGQADSSTSVYRTLEDLRRRTRDRSNLARALVWRGDVLRQEANYGEAREVLREALIEAGASHNLNAAAEAKLLLGALFLALNDHLTAAGYVDQAGATYAALGDSSGLMVARSWRTSVSAAAGDLSRARREALEALGYFRRMGRLVDQWELYQALADLALREGDWVGAERALDEASALMRRHGGTAWAAEQPFERGRVALARGELASAERAFARHLAGLDPAERLWRYEARTRLAEIHARRGELARAEGELRAAGDELDAWRATLADKEMRVLAFQASQPEENDRNASVARVIAMLAAGGRAGAAFELAERRRARELVDGLSRGEALRAGSATPTQEAARWDAGPVTTAEVAARLPDEHTALLEFVVGAGGAPATLFVVQRDGVRARVLPLSDSLGPWVGRFAALMERGGVQESAERSLGAALLDPSLGLLDSTITRLVIVPDGPLHRVPWDALRLPGGGYAVERYAISIAPSAAVLIALGRRAVNPDTGRIRLLALGDPAFAEESAAGDSLSAQEAAETYPSAFAAAGGLPRLAGSAKEARLVARYAARAEVRLRQQASAAYLKRAALDPFRVIHLATHAVVDDRSLTRTALALAPGDGESGFLGPGDLAALKLDADLVVLSACRTAGGMVVEGEGIQGLTAPLLQAGARAVVATRWRIGDRRTVGFVESFYDALAQGLPLGDALRAAKLDAISRGAPPREWAAFTAVGDPLVTVPLRRPPAVARWGLLTALGLAGLAIAFAAWIRTGARAARC